MLASVASMIEQFNIPNIKLLLEMGYEVHVACNFNKGNTWTDEKREELKALLLKLRVHFFQIYFDRNVFMFGKVLIAYRQVMTLVKKYKYDFIHCHSPIGGVIGRSVGHATGIKVIYTVHGFHFFRGAPIKNWILFYPIEKFLAQWTDIIITINKEDYVLAKSRMKTLHVEYIPGVGIDVKKFADTKVDRKTKRKELGIPEDIYLLFSVGELNKNKNHEVVIRAIEKMHNKNIHYAIAGQGDLKDYLTHITNKLGLKNQVHLLGFREDVAELYKMADIFIHPSLREGLPVSVMEAMASKKPLIVSKIRGNRDLVNQNSGYLCNPSCIKDFTEAITSLYSDITLQNKMSNAGYENILKYDLQNITYRMSEIYSKIGI